MSISYGCKCQYVLLYVFVSINFYSVMFFYLRAQYATWNVGRIVIINASHLVTLYWYYTNKSCNCFFFKKLLWINRWSWRSGIEPARRCHNISFSEFRASYSQYGHTTWLFRYGTHEFRSRLLLNQFWRDKAQRMRSCTSNLWWVKIKRVL